MPVTEEKSFALSNFEPYKEKKGEEYMSAEMKEHFKVILNNWKQELM